MAAIGSSVLQAIGRTPLVRLTRVVARGSADVLVKLELANPTGSYKDRMALAMIEGAETRGALRPGMRVNLERAVTPATRLGGHIVQGHVDGRGRLLSLENNGEFSVMRISFPPQLARYFIEKGSVAVDGISLTIASLGSESFDVALIPKTLEMTNLQSLRPGQEVNLEVDMIAKYVERIMAVTR